MDNPALPYFNWGMARCNSCNGMVTRQDLQCYVCGEPVPGRGKPFWRRSSKSKTSAPATPLSNLLFVASLLFTGICLIAPQRVPLTVGITFSAALLGARIMVDRLASAREARAKDYWQNVEVRTNLVRRVTLE